MKDLQILCADHFAMDETGYACGEEHWEADDVMPGQSLDSEFLDAVCNGVLIVGADHKIVSQNYVCRVNMGDLRGETCYKALEHRDAPCEHCPKTAGTHGDYETSMRCAGSACTLYEARIYQLEDGTVAEVYPNMIDRGTLVKNMDMYSEELQLLKEAVESIQIALAEDESLSC